MLLQFAIFIVGLAALMWSADRFVFGASAIAKNFGISPMIIGLTIVAMGSSAPEIVVSAAASLAGNPNTGVGNALGSNITNIALVLGVTALIRPLAVNSLTLRREMPILLLICLLAAYFIFDSYLSFTEGLVLILLFLATLAGLAFLTVQSKSNESNQADDDDSQQTPSSIAVVWVMMGLVLLPASAHFIVESASNIARYWGISDLVIGLTIIALGTSLPELAASVAGLLKGQDDLALGNVVGSNIFNLLAVLAMPGLLSPGVLDAAAAERDIFVMLGLTILLIVFSIKWRGRSNINRYQAGIFVALYCGYMWILFGS